MTDTYSDGTPVTLLPENDEDHPMFVLSADDIRRQARSQAIDDCIKVVRERIASLRQSFRGSLGENGSREARDRTTRLAEAEAIILGLEALKGST